MVFRLALSYDLIITRIWIIKMRYDRIFREVNSLLKKLRNKKLSKQVQHASKHNFGRNVTIGICQCSNYNFTTYRHIVDCSGITTSGIGFNVISDKQRCHQYSILFQNTYWWRCYNNILNDILKRCSTQFWRVFSP